MHVAQIIEATIGGTRRHAVDLCRGLVRRGVRVTLVASALREPAFRADLECLAREGVAVHDLPMVRPIRPATDLLHVRELVALLGSERPDVVHTHSSKAGVLGRLASLEAGVGVRVHTPHTFAFLFGAMFPRRTRALFRAIEGHLAGSTARFVAVSDDEAESFRQSGLIAPERVRVVPNGIDPGPWSGAAALDLGALGIAPGAPVAAVVGLLNLAKGQDLAIEALARAECAGLQLLVVGKGELEAALRARAAALGLAGRAHFLGWRDDVPGLLRAVDFLLLPSRWEGMPYVVLEALAAGCPVVATRVDGVRSLLASTDCGLAVEIGDVALLARAMGAMARLAPEARRALGERGRHAVAARYTVDAMVAGHCALYEELA